jgi:glycosyltransferase involved in cell wall biosynthesis
MKVALVYDRLNKWGGAERVLLALHKLYPDAPLYTSVYDKKNASWANVFDVRTSFLQNFPFAVHHEFYAVLMPMAFESFDFSEFDLVISVTSEAAKGIITKPTTKHICYCLTPTRYLWSGYIEYFKNPILRFLSKPIVMYLRFWDRIAANRPDKYIAISKEVQERIKKYYNQNSTVIYPPLTMWGPVKSNPSRQCSLPVRAVGSPSSFATPYFLIVSRLVSYKKIDLAIEVFNKLKLPLKIIGTGAEMRSLRAMAGSTIEFLGYLTDKELVGYYSGCRALVFPGLEDFGLTILEAQSFGKPVIAYKAGGALETIIEEKTGIFFDKQTVKDLEAAIKQFNDLKINPDDCIGQAKKFYLKMFKKRFMEEILKQVQDDNLEIK